jgi:putative endonuclease
MYYLYILRCADGTFYTGITADLLRRVQEHNAGSLGAKYTRGRRPVKLVYTDKFRQRSTASRAEYRVKQLSRREKLRLITITRQPAQFRVQYRLKHLNN